ncbi:MAG: AAA family ATPase [Actinobacteria bacterium]|nr:AAA family ATPase [Actinomycetota bacterium]
MAKAPFVGRSAELDALHAAFDQADGGTPQVVLVEGEAGIGKTALLARFTGGLDSSLVVCVSGDETESEFDLGVANQLLGLLGAPVESSGPADVYAVGNALLDGVGTRQDAGPLILVVDDFHWLDIRSAQALLFFCRRLRNDRVLVLLAARPVQLDRVGSSWARLLSDPRLGRRIELSGLSAADVVRMVSASGRRSEAAGGEQLWRHTAGNPLYVAALLNELPDRALLGPVIELPAPRAFAATIYARLARLAPATREVIAAVAVVGQRCDVDTAAAIADVPDADAAADAAVASGLLHVEIGPTGDVLHFPHPLVRAAVYNDLSPSHRRALHASAGARLVPPASYQHRVAAVGIGGDERLAVELRELAAVELMRGRYLAAAGHRQAAAAVDPDAERRRTDLYDAVEFAVLGGDLAGAESQADRVAAAPSSAHQRYALAIMDLVSGQVEASFARLVETIEGPDPVPLEDESRIAALLALISVMIGHNSVAISWAERARRYSRAGSLTDSVALQAQAWGHAHNGRFEVVEQLLEPCSAHHRRPAPFETELLATRGIARNWSGDLHGAREDLTTVVRWVQSGAHTSYVTHIYAQLGEAEFRAGDWEMAAEHVELAISLGEDLEHPWHLPCAHSVAAALHSARGELELARGHVDAAAAIVERAGTAESIGYGALAALHLAWAGGDWPGVVDTAGPILRTVGRADGPAEHPNLALWRYRLAEAYVELGHDDEALRLLDDSATVGWGGVSRALRRRLAARRLSGAHRVEDAITLLCEHVESLGDGTAGFEDALAALELGRMLIDRRRRREAIGPVSLAVQTFTRLGAERLRADGEYLLDQLGVPEPVAPPGPLTRLTAKEQVVARMVARGLTNREAAAELFVSTKAVEYHLRNIFAKLDIRSRQDLRRLLGSPSS